MIRQAKRVNCISSLYDKAIKHGSATLKRDGEEKYRITLEENNVYMYHYRALIFKYEGGVPQITDEAYSASDRDAINTMLNILSCDRGFYAHIENFEMKFKLPDE